MTRTNIQISPNYFIRRYQRFENELDEIGDYIPILAGFEKPNYQFGSFRFCRFATDIGTFVDSLFNAIRKSRMLDSLEGFKTISDMREGSQKAKQFMELFIRTFNLTNIGLKVDFDVLPFKPFENILNEPSAILQQEDCWYPKYSRHKHDVQELINVWTLKDCLTSLGCAYLLDLFCLRVVLDMKNEYSSLSHYFFMDHSYLFYSKRGWVKRVFDSLGRPVPILLAGYNNNKNYP